MEATRPVVYQRVTLLALGSHLWLTETMVWYLYTSWVLDMVVGVHGEDLF